LACEDGSGELKTDLGKMEEIKISVQNMYDKGHNSQTTIGLLRMRGKIFILYPKILLKHRFNEFEQR
jgi:hypothetical protein